MKNRILFVVFLFLLINTVSFSGALTTNQRKSLPLDKVPNVELKTPETSEYFPDRIIVKLMPNVVPSISKTGFGIPSLDLNLSHIIVSSVEPMFRKPVTPKKQDDVDISKFYVVTYSAPIDPFTLANELSALDEVQYAEPWFIYKPSFTPNDPSYGLQWGLPKVNAPAAWDIEQGSDTVKIGIVDSGVEWTHQDLSANIWNNPNEIPNNNTDDDNNGFIDDIHGWDFAGAQWQNIQGDNNPSPMGSNNDHGTHVSGIASASTNNSTGVAGLGFNCKILPVKCSADNDTRGPGGVGYILTGYQGIAYAAMMGADAINCSWGGGGGSQTEQDLINFATQQGSLVIAAAGNDNSSGFFSPAGYQNVIGVAATGTNDARASYSNYGENIDVCAPGSNIYSTIYSNTYTYLSGTSMASPFVAGLAGLVKSHFPNYTAQQVGEQMRVTCDNIDGINPGYAGQLGRGRINANTALTNTTLPSIRMTSLAISDSFGGNGNGYPQPSETLSINNVFQNFLAATSNATVQLTTTNTYVTIVSGTFAIGALGTLQTITNSATPFRVFVKANVPQSHKVSMKLTYTDGAFTDIQSFSFLVNPTYQTTNVNSIQLTLTNNGKLGFFDFPNNTQGVGCIFNGTNHLFEGGLLIGNSTTKLVSVVRNPNNAQDADFRSNAFFSLTSPGTVSDQDGSTNFTDSGAATANRLGLRVREYSYAYSGYPNDKYIIVRYDITNITTAAMSGVYVGQFYDWDLGTATANYSNYDETRSLAYVYDSGPGARREYIGMRALDSAAGCRALVNAAGIGLTRADKFNWVSQGFVTTTAGPADIHTVISSGPYNIDAGSTQTVAFAIVAGDSSLVNVQENSDAAKVKWEQIRSTLDVNDGNNSLPSQFALLNNYPNPFNPTTTLSFVISHSSLVSVKVYDVLGREVATLLNNEWAKAGKHEIEFDASALTSGVYFYQLRAGNFSETKKFVLMK
ncbi:MAG: S8 family serine peptidase [Ignavibacteriales bacterium]|nr:S8 family serine peptidase [Ignavibacteriales bacterium]